ncbi:MAG: DUF2891 family protein [Crocinitomicaceae bacterium]
MKHFFILFVLIGYTSFGQGSSDFIINTGKNQLVSPLADGRYTLSDEGASYFAQLSLYCASKSSPHYYFRALRKKGDTDGPRDVWPSFYGCYDWHSSVHNHWCMIKLLKTHPNIPEAAELRQRLSESFTAENILEEVEYVRTHENGLFEFPYGQSWALKVADELNSWNDPMAKQWLKNLMPLTNYIAQVHMLVWKEVDHVKLSGSHDSPAMGLSFAYDYAVAFGDKKLQKVVSEAAMKYYGKLENVAITEEPYEYDFMSASLLVADLMRKVMKPDKYVKWCKGFCPELFQANNVKIPLQIKRSDKHDGYESHWDGYHLNRIWCLNGMLKSIPEGTLNEATKKEWVRAMNDMWDYAQESIGKGNYDIDHWLSSFSVFALIGYD